MSVQGSLNLVVFIEPDEDPSRWASPLVPARFTRLSTAELEAAEAKLPKVHPAGTSYLQLQTVAKDGSVRAGTLSIHPLDDGTALAGDGVVLLRRETDVIRLAVGARVVYEQRRPASEPQVETVLLEAHPLRIAVRARGITSPFHLTLNDLHRAEIHSIGQLNPLGEGELCWTLVANLPELQGGGASSFRFVLRDFFHEWSFSSPGPKAVDRKP